MKALSKLILLIIILWNIFVNQISIIVLNTQVEEYNQVIHQQQVQQRSSDDEVNDLKHVIKVLDNTNYSNLSISELFRVVANNYQVDFDMVYAIAIHETGDFTSQLWQSKNNAGGMKCGDDWCEFDSPLDGITAMVKNLKFNYIDLGLTTLERIQPKYCPDSDEWVSKVSQFMIDINNGKYQD